MEEIVRGRVELTGLVRKREDIRKIAAIKTVRYATGLDLLTAKNLVEDVLDRNLPRTLTIVRGTPNIVIEELAAAGIAASAPDTLEAHVERLAELMEEQRTIRKKIATELRARGVWLPNIRHTSNKRLLDIVQRLREKQE